MLVSLIALSFAFAETTTAQTEPSGWPVEQRCITALTDEPDPNAEFSGTILLDGWAGIHAMQADWDTTYIVAFLDRTIGGGALSPDGRWYVAPHGHQSIVDYDMDTSVPMTTVTELYIYETIDSQQPRKLEWFTQSTERYAPQVWWRDNENFLYGQFGTLFSVNVRSGASIQWATPEHWRFPLLSYTSPDWMLTIYNPRYTSYLSSEPDRWNLTDVTTNETIVLHQLAEADYPQIAWSSDSQSFAAEIPIPTDPDADNPRNALALFDRDGAQIASMFDLPERVRVASSFNYDVKDIVWSSDGRYIAFITYIPSYPPVSSLYIIDTLDQIVIDTCLVPSDGLAWSPEGSQLALMAEGDEHRPLFVLDVETEELSWITRHEGNVIGWREN